MQFLLVLIISISVVLLCLAGLGIKVLLRKNGQFKRHCASIDPYTGNGSNCQCSAKQLCNEADRHPYQPLDVNKNLMEELSAENL